MTTFNAAFHRGQQTRSTHMDLGEWSVGHACRSVQLPTSLGVQKSWRSLHHLSSAYQAHKCPLLKGRKHFKAISLRGILIRTRGTSRSKSAQVLCFTRRARLDSTKAPCTSSVCIFLVLDFPNFSFSSTVNPSFDPQSPGQVNREAFSVILFSHLQRQGRGAEAETDYGPVELTTCKNTWRTGYQLNLPV